ncbi:site-specific DNA-methyltransferase [Candidatus Kaiserbacteria bacterium]|nr:site-specific DNA-methyltransferase [Candidatus Kaiserbacteria bacterium]
MQAQSKADGTALKAGVEACGGTRLPNGTTPHLDSTPIRTLGWQPGCECSGEPVPCTVLDPFTGSGTTAVVALNNGRNFVGTELNPDYVKLAEDRISQSVVPSLF